MLEAVETPLSEPVAVGDIYVSGLHHVEDMGDGNYRLIFFTNQGEDHNVTCKLIATLPAILCGVKLLMRSLGYCCCGAVLRAFRH